MPGNRTPQEQASHETADALDRWDDEGGAAARMISEALLAQVNALAPMERQVLQCLGAAVVIRWNDLPTDVQRILFKVASANGVSEPANPLPARIARFLHDHKNPPA